MSNEKVDPLVVAIMGQMASDAHHTHTQIERYLEERAARYRLLEDAVCAYANTVDSRSMASKLFGLVHSVSEVPREIAVEVVSGARIEDNTFRIAQDREYPSL